MRLSISVWLGRGTRDDPNPFVSGHLISHPAQPSYHAGQGRHKFPLLARQFPERTRYNEERPHEALHYRTPASCYRASSRPYPRRVPELAYDEDIQVRRISQQGSLKWKGERANVRQRSVCL
jgi:hypothetical protein